MKLTDYRYPDMPTTEGTPSIQPPARRRRTRGAPPPAAPQARSIVVPALAGLVIMITVAMLTYQLAHPPRPLGVYPTETITAQPTGRSTEAPTSAPTSAPTATALGYDRQLPAGVLGGFGKQPRDQAIGGRHFMLINCDGWDCYIELEDGARLWIDVAQAGEPAPTPTVLVAAPPPAPTVCATAHGISGEATRCGYGYAALLAQAQEQAGAPIDQAPPANVANPGADAYATQQALGNQTAYAVQTQQAHIIETQTAIASASH